VVWEKGALTGIEVKHNRRYGADCVQRLGPTEIAAEIAAPHQNEGPHLAAGFWAGPSANRSGARGKHDVPGRPRPMRKNGQQDPETARLRSGSAPIPPAAIVSGDGAPVKTSLRRRQRGLDRGPVPAKTNTILGWGNGSSLDWSPVSSLQTTQPPVGRHRDFGGRSKLCKICLLTKTAFS